MRLSLKARRRRLADLTHPFAGRRKPRGPVSNWIRWLPASAGRMRLPVKGPPQTTRGPDASFCRKAEARSGEFQLHGLIDESRVALGRLLDGAPFRAFDRTHQRHVDGDLARTARRPP